jgi:hypothetical protein
MQVPLTPTIPVSHAHVPFEGTVSVWLQGVVPVQTASSS